MGTERPMNRNNNRRALSDQYLPVRRKSPPGGPESSLFVDSGLSIRGLLIGGVNV